MSDFTVRVTDWDHDAAGIRAVREAVFITEQRIPPAEEWDAHDAVVPWVLAESADGEPIGCGRLLPDGHVGRMAVLAAWRGRGVGETMLRELLMLARERGDTESILSAQVHAIPFYARLGYAVRGEEYMEAGIPHREMRLDLRPRARPADLSGRGPATETERLRTVAQHRDAVLALAQTAQRSLCLYTTDLEPALYDQPEFLAAVRGLALRGRVPRVRVLVVDPQRAVREGHRLIELSQHLSSFVHIRVPDPDLAPPVEGYLIGDDDAIVHRTQADQPLGVFEAEASTLARAKLREFERLWERATTDPSLRRLHV
jgi:predicted GNAT family N-acyltransferase